MSTNAQPRLDATETQLVERSKTADSLTGRELQQLVHQLRERRERIKRAVRERARSGRRQGKVIADTGALAKQSELAAAIDRVSDVLNARNPANWDGEAVRGPSKPASGTAATARKPKPQSKPQSKPKTQSGTKSETKASKPATAKPAAKAAKPTSEAKPKAETKTETKTGAKAKPKA
jgi:hypothetical protein